MGDRPKDPWPPSDTLVEVAANTPARAQPRQAATKRPPFNAHGPIYIGSHSGRTRSESGVSRLFAGHPPRACREAE